ncbi:DLW-39 family protein [Cellulomonas endophytica]|nr:DLW-39 family protein [Cellulomonas endophytica]
MKKTLLVVAAGALAFGAYRRWSQDRDERELWAEVTDELD